jgi:tRNA-dihydrouridine synthase
VLQGFSGLADWTKIALAKSTVTMPVIGNGDVTGSLMATDMMRSTGCDGVMIGRAAASNPWVFSAAGTSNIQRCSIYSAERRRAIIYEHCMLLKRYMDSRRVGFFMRGVLLRYTKGLTASTAFRNSISCLKTPEELMEAADRYLSSMEGTD